MFADLIEIVCKDEDLLAVRPSGRIALSCQQHCFSSFVWFSTLCVNGVINGKSQGAIVSYFENHFRYGGFQLLLDSQESPSPKRVQHASPHCLLKEILSQQIIRHFKILQSIYFAYDVGIISSYSHLHTLSNNCKLEHDIQLGQKLR